MLFQVLIKHWHSSLDDMSSRYQKMILRVDDNLDDTLKSFENHVIMKREGLVNLINQQHELLEKAYTENVTKFDKFDLLDNLTVLPEIKQGFDQHQSDMLTKQVNHVDQVNKLGLDIHQNKEQISTIVSTLNEVNSKVSNVTDRKEEISKLNSMYNLVNKLKEEVEKNNESFFKRIFQKK